jgi:DNA-binding protein HU-beta
MSKSAVNKSDFISKLAERMEVSQAEAKRTYEAFVDVFHEALGEADSVRLTGLGVFTPYTRSATSVRNPKTGEMVQVPAKPAIRFKPSAEVLAIA